jgi:hypothetical protein
MNIDDIKTGKTYRSKRPAPAGSIFQPYFNDRQVIWCSHEANLLQYDSPSVALGRKYPKVTIDKFLKWVGKDVTDELPEGEWAAWR